MKNCITSNAFFTVETTNFYLEKRSPKNDFFFFPMKLDAENGVSPLLGAYGPNKLARSNTKIG